MTRKIHKNYFDIVILPTKEIGDYSIALSKRLHKYGSNSILGRKSFLPHISLYHISIKKRDFGNFIAEIEKITNDFKTGQLEIKDLILWKGHRSVLLMTNKPKWLKNLHLKIIKGTLKYFNWDYGIEKLWNLDHWSKLMQKNIKQYGTPLVGRYFMPHITLGVLNDKKGVVKFFNKLKLKKYKFNPVCIYVCEIGEDHTCQKIVRKIRF